MESCYSPGWHLSQYRISSGRNYPIWHM